MKFTVKKGKKAFWPVFNLGFFLKKPKNFKEVNFSIKLSKELLYNRQDIEATGNEREDWLKAVGVSSYDGLFGWANPKLNNRDALLIAFRSDPAMNGLFQVTHYLDKDYDFDVSEKVLSIAPDQEFRATIIRKRKNIYSVVIIDSEGNRAKHEFQFNERKRLKILAPYHGGSVPARRNAIINLSWAK